MYLHTFPISTPNSLVSSPNLHCHYQFHVLFIFLKKKKQTKKPHYIQFVLPIFTLNICYGVSLRTTYKEGQPLFPSPSLLLVQGGLWVPLPFMLEGRWVWSSVKLCAGNHRYFEFMTAPVPSHTEYTISPHSSPTSVSLCFLHSRPPCELLYCNNKECL